MFDILYIWNSEGPTNRPIADLEKYCMVEVRDRCGWKTADGTGTVYTFGSHAKPASMDDRIEQSAESFRALKGWAITADGRPTAKVAEVTSEPRHGEYLLLEVNELGNGSIRTDDLGSVQLYSYSDDKVSLLSTRASLIAGYLGRFDLNVDFARWVINHSVPATHDAVFEGVSHVPGHWQVRLVRGRPVITAGAFDLLKDDSLARLYQTDRVGYWDQLFQQLLEIMKVVELHDAPLRFPISGGKDSRLLLALLVAAGYKDRISTTFTRGPSFSPEVISGKAVADALGLTHEFDWNENAKGVDAVPDVEQRLLKHLFISEGEVSPMDLLYNNKINDRFDLPGQEAGLRNIAGNRDVSSRAALRSWMGATFGAGDFCAISTLTTIERCNADIEAFIDRAEAEGTEYEQVPTLHRVMNRGSRWVSRIWGVQNSLSFSPHVFRSFAVTQATYNAGARSRQLEEFHYEMLRRANPELISIPFANQTWNPALEELTGSAPPAIDPLKWPDDFTVFKQRGMFGILSDRLPEIRSFIAETSSERLRSVIDMDRLREVETIPGPGFVQPFWQAFQCALLERIGDFSDLQSKTPEEIGLSIAEG